MPIDRDNLKIGYTLPRFDDWQADHDWRLQLNVDVYVETVDVGRGVYLSGRVSWNTIPGFADRIGWFVAGEHVYRVTESGSALEASDLPPTAKMAERLRNQVLPHIFDPSDELRLRVAADTVRRRNHNAENEFRRANEDTAKLLARFEDAMAVPLGTVGEAAS